MLSDNHIFKVVIVISQISIKNFRAVKKNLRKKRFFVSLIEGLIYMSYFFCGGRGWGIFWVKSEAINQQENKLLGLYDHIGNIVLKCLAP